MQQNSKKMWLEYLNLRLTQSQCSLKKKYSVVCQSSMVLLMSKNCVVSVPPLKNGQPKVLCSKKKYEAKGIPRSVYKLYDEWCISNCAAGNCKT